jgi:hypothetical protein
MTDYRTNQNDHGDTHIEDAAFPGLTVVNLKQQSDSVDQNYKNFVVVNINNHCVRLAVMQGEFRWHQHPRSDEERSVVWFAGVRRVGKTCLCQDLPEVEYFDCELPRIRRMMLDPESFLDGLGGKRIVLEIHRLQNPSDSRRA